MATELEIQDFNATQIKILDAAITCVQLNGADKTSLNDIARQAGVTRPTVYSYFSNCEQVVKTALLRAGYAFAKRLIKHIKRFDDTQTRLIEAVCFALDQLPKEPYLASITQAGLSSYVNEDALIDAQGQEICIRLFEQIFEYETISDQDLIEVIEIVTRVLLSLLIIKGPIDRSPEELRGFLKRRLVPACLG